MTRRDLQCLRGIAIAFVLLYHLFPSVFANGFLGVDVFFVLSGYLMACQLTKKSLKSVWDIGDFYYRRFKRLLPLYHLLILGSVVLLHCYLSECYWKSNQRYSVASLLLVTNQLVIHDSQDYFQQFQTDRTSRNVFIHLWSLSLEIQFYLLVPFLFFGIQQFKSTSLKLITSLLITVFGMVPFSLINHHFAFNFMFLRLWQFSAGFTALFWEKMTVENTKNTEKPQKTQNIDNWKWQSDHFVILSLVIIFGCLIPGKLDILIFRPLVTIATAVIIAVSGDKKENMILQSNCLSYLGDLSYSLYLIHWPIICIFSGNHPTNYIFCIVSTFLISILLHHFFEKIYLKLAKPAVISLIVFLILCNVWLQYSTRNHGFWKPKFAAGLQKIVDDNMALDYEDEFWEAGKYFKEQCMPVDWELESGGNVVFGNCRFVNGTGTQSVLMTGNSYSMNIVESLKPHFHGNHSIFQFTAVKNDNGLFVDWSVLGSDLALDASRIAVERMKPDVLFLVSRFSKKMFAKVEENDEIIRQMNENLKFYQRFAKRIYILAPQPVYTGYFLNHFLHSVTHQPEELETFHLDKIKTDVSLRNAMQRFEQIDCSKCEIFDLKRGFLENDKYLTYDRTSLLSYIDNSLHFTAPGLRVLRPVFEELADGVMRRF